VKRLNSRKHMWTLSDGGKLVDGMVAVPFSSSSPAFRSFNANSAKLVSPPFESDDGSYDGVGVAPATGVSALWTW
jgi:hypothetical protein